MAGRPGRSGGWNRLSPEEHQNRGTHYRKPPRAGLAAAVAPLPGPWVDPVLPVPAAVVAGLSGRGLAFVEHVWPNYTGWTAQAQELLREVGALLTQIEQFRGQPEERAAQRMLLATLAALNLKD